MSLVLQDKASVSKHGAASPVDDICHSCCFQDVWPGEGSRIHIMYYLSVDQDKGKYTYVVKSSSTCGQINQSLGQAAGFLPSTSRHRPLIGHKVPYNVKSTNYGMFIMFIPYNIYIIYNNIV